VFGDFIFFTIPIYYFQINPNQSGAKLDDPDLHLEFVYAINDVLKDLVLYLIKIFNLKYVPFYKLLIV